MLSGNKRVRVPSRTTRAWQGLRCVDVSAESLTAIDAATGLSLSPRKIPSPSEPAEFFSLCISNPSKDFWFSIICILWN